MLSTLLIVVVIIALGSGTADNLRVRQQEIILARLPEAEAAAYYDVLRRRVRFVRLLRAVALVSLLVIVYAYKYKLSTLQLRVLSAVGEVDHEPDDHP